jgi:hypothetical protein
MRTERKTFSGIMNLDDPNEVIPANHHREAKNILFKGNGGERRAESIPGNTSISNANLQTGNNVCIGSYYDELKQRVFYFVYNSLGYDAIFVYNTLTKSVSTLLMSLSDSQAGEHLFSFDPDYPIASVNILYRSDADGDILHWTDRKNAPMKLNIKEAEAVNKTYNGFWKRKYLTVARAMPLISPICKYENDNTTNINNLRSKLYQFKYRWVYRDDTKSTWSPWSRLFAPVNVDALVTEVDPTKNNRISITYTTGAADVVKIEIAARQSLDVTFSEPFLVKTLDKASLSISNDTTSIYYFYNTESNPYIDLAESDQLFDYVPHKANTQELLNGNMLIYGGITEGRTPGVSLTVAKSTSLVENTVTIPFTFVPYTTVQTFIDTSFTPNREQYQSGHWYIAFNGTPKVGETYSFDIYIRYFDTNTMQSVQDSATITLGPLTAGQDNFTYLEDTLYTLLTTNPVITTHDLGPSGANQVFKLTGADAVLPGKYGVKIGGSTLAFAWTDYTTNYQYNYTSTSLPLDPTGVNTACYKHKSRYSFGICYFDENGVTNGVMTTDNLKVVTPEIVSSTLAVSPLTIPMIQFTVTNLAPTWAKYFSFVRTTNLTAFDFKTIVTTTTGLDTTNNYAYLDITDYQNNKNGYPTYSFTKGDRVRIIGRKNQPDEVSESQANDYSILALMTSAEVTNNGGMTTPASVPANKIWLRIPYDSATMTGFNFGNASYYNYYIEVYTPALNASDENQLYYEFGETYNVLANRYHEGMIQNQGPSQGAIFRFVRGDAYTRTRDGSYILDTSMSDKYGSKVDGNGRPFIQDDYAKEAYYPTLVRYSLPYQAGTSINQTNRFYGPNFDEYDRERGDIQRLKTRGRQLRVFQNRACGVVPILQNVLQTAAGSDVVSQSTEIINKIQYYLGDYGIGNQYCSLASSAQADYFTDPIRGCQVRVSTDGLTSITELYKAHFYLNPLITKYNKVRTHISTRGKAKILGIYDQFNEEFVTAMQESTGSLPDKTEPYTFGFNEFRNSYTSFYDYSPEWMCTAENLIISWKNGILYTHDNTTNYANFYGVQYKPSITLLFNDIQPLKKRYNTITMLANKVWSPSTNGDITTNLGQSSSLQAADFIFKDDKIHAAFRRDANSTGGLLNGNVLKGNWAKLKLQPTNGNEFVNLYYIDLGILQPLNNR